MHKFLPLGSIKLSHSKRLLTYVAAFCLSAASANGAALLFDFGPTVSPTGSNATISPYQQVQGALSNPSWNRVQLADIGSGLLYADGAAATGISINLGIESGAGSGVIDLATQPIGSIAGTAGTAGTIYEAGLAARDAIHSGTTNFALGLRIDGLSAGQYTLYFTARNTNTGTVSATRGERLYASVGASASTFNFSGFSSADVTNNAAYTAAQSGTFVNGTHYNTLNFTIATGQSLFIAADGYQADETRGFLNTLEVVSVPEPNVAVLLGFGGLGILVLRNRRKSASI